MKIIDAHIHFCRSDVYFDRIAAASGHLNTPEHLRAAFDALGVEQAVVMGNRGLELDRHVYPGWLSYCVGIDRIYLQGNKPESAADLVEAHLERENCVGIKLYPGYSDIPVTDPAYNIFFELAQRFGKPVAIHTGATSTDRALLKYSHPLVLDELAVRHPKVRIVMCHFGNPWLVDAAAVLEKNPNVAADLSGMLVGRTDLETYFCENSGYIDQLRTWLTYADAWDRIMFGTDWPLANLEEYISFVKHFVPEKHWDPVFYDNAKQIYGLK
jgi:predicted TIM-barrel fold metal-dependent hydrolase